MIIDKAKADALDLPERRAYYAEVLRGVYDEIQLEWTEKLERYNAHWQKHERAVNEAFGEQFGRELVGSFNDIQGRMGLNSVCPRFLDERAFDVFWHNSECGAMGIALHEMTRFAWFSIWQQHFRDCSAEYDMPHLTWILSEMAVECYLPHPTLRALPPYFERENGRCIYPYFYDMELDGVPLCEQLFELFVPGRPEAFMEASCERVRKHEKTSACT